LKDYLKVQWGQNIPDSWIQRPEYLAGEKQPFKISEVLNTSDTVNAPQGQMAGHGIAFGNDCSFRRQFKEHGFILILQVTIPKAVYQKPLASFWKKFDYLDYAIPALANLGRQEIKKGEVDYRFENTEASHDSVFAYAERYEDDKSMISSVAGDFRDNLAYWSFIRLLSANPGFDESFLACDPGKNPFAITDEHTIYSQIQHNISVLRALPYYPSLKLQ